MKDLSIGEDFDCHYWEHSGLWADDSPHFIRFTEERLTIAEPAFEFLEADDN